ncbi:ankyrin repeat-containing domain protein [Paraphysoderma sedebokerense]|nr:ankyrin repeat-containing domain protein [Paraphysoderma sedebokerense]
MSFLSSLNALRSKLNSSSLSDDELIHEILTQARINASGLPPSQRDSSLSLLLKVTDDHGRGLLNYSCGYGRAGVVKFILELQGTVLVDSRDIHGDTPLHRAARFNHTAIIRLLVSYNANIELKDKQNQTPLFLAACTRKQSAAVELIKNGAELVVDGVSLWCAMEKSRYSGGFAKIQELKQSGIR